jgi:sigma-54-specific transcriptional regulator
MNHSPHIITFPDPRSVSMSIRASAVVFADPKSLQLLSLIDRVAPSNANILIIGETGTGKELVARQVHLSSLRAASPSWPSIAAPFPKPCSKANCSVSKRAPSPGP